MKMVILIMTLAVRQNLLASLNYHSMLKFSQEGLCLCIRPVHYRCVGYNYFVISVLSLHSVCDQLV